MLTQVQRLNELATVKYSIEKVVGMKEPKNPVGEESILLLVRGKVVAGIDLAGLTPGDVTGFDGSGVRIRLMPPRIQQAYLDEKYTKVWDRSITWWTPWVTPDADLEHKARMQATRRYQGSGARDGNSHRGATKRGDGYPRNPAGVRDGQSSLLLRQLNWSGSCCFPNRSMSILPVGNPISDMREKTDVRQGTLALMVLKTLDVLGPLHGYGMARRIEQISGDLLTLNQGTLYPVLLKLEQEGSITSEWGASENNRRARFYRLTRDGRKQLQAETRDWEQTAEIIARFFAAKAKDLK